MTSPVNTFAYQEMLMTPQSMPYVDQAHVWLPPPHPASPPISASSPYQTHSPSPMPHLYYFPPAPQLMTSPYTLPARPSSAEPVSSQLLSLYSLPPGLPASGQQPLPPLCAVSQYAAEREEGKGERASRISLHLRMSSRHRSASPPAHRYPTSVASEPHASVAPLSAPTTVTMSSMPQERTNISPSSSSHTFHRTVSLNLPVSPAHSQGSVISPRPMLSPKHSFSNDPFSQISQVEQLERIAARVENEHPDMSLSKAELDFNVDLSHKKEKSLPAVPVPAASSARADVGALLSNPELLVDQTPPTPTLAAVTSLKVPRASADPSVCGGASGLDALEAKLLAEVGTQKVEKNEGRTDVRAVLPIPIPRVNDGVDPANDSAISSLTLPGLGSQGKTLKLEQAIHGDDDEDDDRALTEGREHRKNSKDSKKVASSISRFSKDKVQHSGKCSGERAVTGKTDEVHRLRKTARGRVTAWLGSIEPDVPPQSGTPPSSSPTAIVADLTDLPREDAHGRVAAWLNGIGRDTKPQPNMSPSIAMKDALLETAKPTQVDVATYGPPATDQPSEDPVDSPVTDVSAAPHPRSSGFVPIGTLRANKLKEPVAIGKVEVRDSENNPQLISTKQGPPSFPRLAVGSPRSDSPEVRYDIRSARGGRGGKVTAAAAIWASAAQQSEKVDVTKLKHVSAKRLDVALLQPTRSPPSESPVHSKSPISSDRSSVPVGPPAKSAKTSGSTTPTQLDVIPFSATDLTAKRARMIKSTSVPAIISSSLATPMLSSTASLARPSPPLIDRDKANHRLSPAVSEGQPSLNAKSTTAKPPPIKGDLAFGQARLRELIKRYQGQANS
ncbi:hypothetical protein AcV5_008907 [Taiwanofungus camphoratus]|nr:hypothetical protein AcV5_008907 [Antrodia cinnamomea]KAI0956512.1 hypothetical protein AcV7_006897 [Antrodia cinnamomea]